MNSAITVFLCFLLLLGAQAQPGHGSSRCKCANSFVGRVHRQLIQGEPLVHEPNSFCTKTEIIVTIANKEKCVNPQSPLGKLILKNKQRQGTQAAARPTTASTQTDSYSSTASRR